jgi:peptidoglycan/LPS O-acetylase OafA/YrhL
LGVHLFWCISGFIFFWKYSDAIASRTISGKKFFVLRFSRLYPLHFVTLLVVALLQWMHLRSNGNYHVYVVNDLPSFMSQLFLASNWLPSQPWSFNGPIWSVSLEVLAYLVFFVVLRLLGNSWQVTAGIFIVGVLALIAGYRASLIQCLTFFYAGGVVALLAKVTDQMGIRRAALYGAGIASVLLAALGYILQLHKETWFDWYLYLLLLGPAIIFLSTVDMRLGARWTGWVETAGNMTYSTYLLHFPIGLTLVLASNWLDVPLPRTSAWMLFVYLALVMGLAVPTFRYFEAPLQEIIRRWHRSARPAGASKAVIPPPGS